MTLTSHCRHSASSANPADKQAAHLTPPETRTRTSCQSLDITTARQIIRQSLPIVLLGLGLSACSSGGQGGPSPHAAGKPDTDTPAAIAGAVDTTRPHNTHPAVHGTDQGQPPQQTPSDGPHTEDDQPPVTHPPFITETGPRYQADCQRLLAQARPLRSGRLRYADPQTARPAAGQPHEDPVYQSCVTRITDQATKHPAQYWGTDTPRRQVFNADSSAFLLHARDGSWRVHDAHTGRVIKTLDHIRGIHAEPQWHATDPNLIHYLPNNGLGMQIHELRVDRNESRLLADLGTHLRQHWPQATHAWTVGHGSPSADGRYWCLLAERLSDDGQGWQAQGVFTWDMQAGRIIGTLPLASPAHGAYYRPSHVSTSPSGQYCLVAAPYPTGTRIYQRDFSQPFSASVPHPYLQVSTEDHDSDMALNRAGEDIYVSVNYNHGQARGEVYMVNLATQARRHLFDNHIGGTIGGLQFSGKGYQQPGWMLVSSHAERTHGPDPSKWVRNLRHEHPARQWHHRKLFAISLDQQDGNGKALVKTIANMHNDWWLPDSSQVHAWPVPNATVSRDFSRMLFSSTWNSHDPRDIDSYLVSIPANGLDAAATP
ncbi:MAG: hypothetical protein Q4D91_04585 [Lautropia sp.]|nr:hypothetical protein [Lautropia sp.]